MTRSSKFLSDHLTVWAWSVDLAAAVVGRVGDGGGGGGQVGGNEAILFWG